MYALEFVEIGLVVAELLWYFKLAVARSFSSRPLTVTVTVTLLIVFNLTVI